MTGTLPGAGNLEEVTRRVGDDVGTAEVVILRMSAGSSDPLVDGQLDVRWTAPVVVAGEVVTHPPHRSPLAVDEHGQYPTVLRGGIVDDPGQVELIRSRVGYGELPLWRRAITATPQGWR